MSSISTRLPIVYKLDVERPNAGHLGNDLIPGGRDVVYSKYTDDTAYAETRPSLIGYSHGPENEPSVGGARGLFYWETAESLITVYKSTVYEGIYGNTLITLDTGNKEPVYWAEYSSTQLVMTDPAANKVYVIEWNGSTLSAREITTQLQQDLQDEGIAGGVVALDNYIFLMSKAGKIYNCAVGDLETWNALDFQTTERAVDPGIYLAKQQEHVVAISSSSIEIYYDAANPEGSPLKRRDDVSFLTGAIAYNKVHTNGEKLFFIGSSRLGSYAIFFLENLRLTQISYHGLDAWVNDTLLTYKKDFVLSSGTLGEHYLLYVTSVSDGGDHYIPVQTAVYDVPVALWGRFRTQVTEQPGYEESFPVIAITERLGVESVGQTVMLVDGTLAIYSLEYRGVDTFSGLGPYVTIDGTVAGEALYWDPGYTTTIGSDASWNINPRVVTEEWDGGTYTNKFMSRMAVVGRSRPSATDSSGNIIMRYSDDTYESWSDVRTTPAIKEWMYTRLGKCKRRAFMVGYEGTDHIRFENIEVGVGGSKWA